MKYYEESGSVILEEFDSFDIEQILECGQCFRFEKIAEKEYTIVAFSKVLNIKQTENKIKFFPATKKDFEEIWLDYFDLKRDYSKIKAIISKDDEIMKKAVEFAPDIRILNQDSWECLISFIISQNNRIPMIKQVIKNISERYGSKFGEYYLFPTLEQILNADENSLIACKTGFRAKYIIDAIKNVSNGNIDFEKLKEYQTDDARSKLMEIKGVGQKVSDCVLLFSMRRGDVFPTDVWIKRVMEHFYFGGEETKIKTIHEFAQSKFGEYAGFAQQYLFHYARTILK